MWFGNATIYLYDLPEVVDLESLLSSEQLKPCPPHARFIYGWLPVFQEQLTQVIAGATLICLGKEERLLPRNVINQMLASRIESLENQQGKKLKRSDKAHLAQELEFELLPKSFCIQKRLLALFDTQQKRLIVNTSSENQAAQLTSLLRKTIPQLHLERLCIQDNLTFQFSNWIINPQSLPSPFQLASDCLLIALDNEKKRIHCKGYELPATEINHFLEQGLSAQEIALIWNDRIQFTLTPDLTIKRLKMLDYLADEFDNLEDEADEYLKRDASLALISGELRALINDLLKSFDYYSSDLKHQKERVTARVD